MTYKTLGIIPAAGNASRFNRTPKELLPVGDGLSLLMRTVSMMRFYADDVVIITKPSKAPIHMIDVGAKAIYLPQEGDNDIFSAIMTAVRIPAERYLFAMPDTFIPPAAFSNMPSSMFSLGLFDTDKPERFGVLQDKRIANKKRDIEPPCMAWGVLSWTQEVVEHWRKVEPENYTHAINCAMAQFGFATWKLDYYYDMATFDDYSKFIRETYD